MSDSEDKKTYQERKTLKDLAGNKVIITPRSQNDSDIAVVAWGRLDTFNKSEFNINRIKDFIKRYKNRGPEKVSPSLHGI
ncbi:MAG: hypothetical protein COV57_00655 [Candidatus Liptonbacteria bacterium CG11_big_fil_rev_8_21_14_0_20_35_14]|uniref:DUF3105 domain-containing protein n=1 Tax=Candidatus Liptonbacteria bacterium CG11_big_fil_rev_8_21_14_0_20_35_14 TaxID=1974634 RepID=A0A2H0N8B1_9BACT|nr:MAG: hypothetical protein COV57_00655 [Candidatus Liptonbacteria bacterium CG11_big_fil_rev_8_21_14_0_20_35_14]